MKKLLYTSLIFLSAYTSNAQSNILPFVNPLIGTQKMGHTYPGATVPFGAVQLSPDTDTIPFSINGKYNPDVYRYCAGYQYDDASIVGFSHTHFSGTGHSDLGDFLIMPSVGALQLNPGTATNPKAGYRSRFSHTTEKAQPGYYSVRLEDDNILAELTATARTGVHRYTFPKTDSANIVLDLMHGIYNYNGKSIWAFVRIENDSTVTGFRQTLGWGRTRIVYFAMVFSKKFSNYGNRSFEPLKYNGFWRRFNQSKNFPEFAGTQIRAYFNFATKENEAITVKFALSPVSTNNALENLKTEAGGKSFNDIKKQAQQQWEQQLSVVDAAFLNNDDKTNFYTALYHTMLSPTMYMDVNKQYKGIDQNVYTAKGFTNYTTFSLWDTYRALHPLFNIIAPARNRDMVQSMLVHQQQSAQKMLPIWSHYANENWCMSGYHAVSVISDAIVKGNIGFDANKALDACVQTANTLYYDALDKYLTLGYVPEDVKPGVSVSTTLEFAYDDWCIAQAAKKLRRTDVYNIFLKRSQNWKTLYDASTGFMRPRLSDGSFRKEFDPLSTHNQGFIEGNAWNFSLFVPHDPSEMIKLMGGESIFLPHLDSLFTMHLPDKFFEETEDITRDGIIGNYVHGNEPSHHVAYLYNFTSKPWKTQERIRMILQKQYKPTTDGLGGNDDCGQMSAWYIFSALGFYPFAPGSDRYELGSPLIKSASIKLENGKRFTIKAENQTAQNVYVKSVTLNGKILNRNYITHDEIVSGGHLVFHMTNTHN